jgi:tRNA-modifying protein YgfZ
MTIVDTSEWAIITLRGADRVRFLQGLTTINLTKVVADRPHWGAILNPKGRVLAVIAVEGTDDECRVRCQPDIADKTLQILERYAVMDEVSFTLSSQPSYRIWTQPSEVWSAPFLDGLAPDSPSSPAEIEIARIRGGFLRYGQDVDEDCFPFETPLATFLDYEKGCYVGQEPVFRVHSQGNTARTLRGLTIAGDEPIAIGESIRHPAKDRAGVVTSVARNGADGSWVALGYLHRTTWDVGQTVTIAGRRAEVHALPF